MTDGFSQNLNQKTDLKQEQTLSARQIQSLRILTAPSAELQSVIEQELEQNPVLEIEKPEYEQALPSEETAPEAEREPEDTEEALRDLLEYTAAGASPAELAMPFDPSDDAEDRRSLIFESMENRESLQEHLIAQLRIAAADEKTFRIGEALIGSIDESGYLRTHPADIAMAENCSMDDVENVLKLVHTFDPPGIGARDLKECLILQIPPDDPDKAYLRKLIEKHLDDIARQRFSAICSDTGLPLETVRKLILKIRKLNPFPGGAVGESVTQYITPEAEIVPDGDGFRAVVSERNIPRLKLSEYYLQMLDDPETQKDAKEYLKEKIRNARMLMESLDKRKTTIGKVTELIVSEQFEFLKNGVEFLRPMTMKLIADKLGLNESTVSRAVSGKYVRTPQGTFEFKYFFSGGFQSDDGSSVSSRSIRELIRELVDDEDPRSPLSDSKLTELLTGKGIDIRRRTVAKYREELGIPPSHLRKAVF